MQYEEYLSVIDEKKEELCEVSDTIWAKPELCFAEVSASKLLTEKLEENGFTVTRNLVGIPTAFKASFGTGSPSLGVLAEFDGLSGLSQEGEVAERRPIPDQDTCHGCGHNLFAAGSLAAVLAVKKYIEKTGKGSITLFGCPAEEGGGGKVFMARDGAFDGIDAIVSWHPESMYMVRTRPALANIHVDYDFKGITAHAGAAPHQGRSALDAVELMNIGCQFLREHMLPTSRIHYAITDTGGTAANMVQSHASVTYLIRATTCQEVLELKDRVDLLAKGAATMTETEFTSKVTSAYSNLITIPTLQKIANEAMHDIPLPVPTEEELAFGKALQATMKLSDEAKTLPPFSTFVKDPAPPVAHGGSTDTADVSWVVPTVQMHVGTWVIGTPGHSWQSTSQSRGSYAKRSALWAGKAVAASLMRLMDRPEELIQAKKEHTEKTGGKYTSPIPADLKPKLPQ